MIGANSSPLSMFTGRSENGPSMYQIGYQGGPGGGINAALNATIDRYHANIDAQNQQNMKLSQINAESNVGLGKEKALVDYKNQAELDKAGKINDMNKALPNNGLRMATVNGRNIFLQDKVGNSGVMEPNVVQPAPYPTMDQIVGQKMQAQMDANGAPAPNIIQQGANGAVADSTGQQTPQTDPIAQGIAARSTATKILTDAGQPVTEANIQYVLKQSQK